MWPKNISAHHHVHEGYAINLNTNAQNERCMQSRKLLVSEDSRAIINTSKDSPPQAHRHHLLQRGTECVSPSTANAPVVP